jgi:type VI secretion system secreted protein VgrG
MSDKSRNESLKGGLEMPLHGKGFSAHTNPKYAQLKLLDPWKKEKYGSLIKVSGQESISNLFEYNLTLITEKEAIEKEVFCNKELSFAVQSPSYDGQDPKEERYYHGIIKSAAFWKETADHMYMYQLVLVPKLYQAAQLKRTNVFFKEKQVISDVIEVILKEYNIKHKFELEGKDLFAAETCIQFNETDFDFLTRIMSQAGFFYFFQHDKGFHEMVISNHPNSYFSTNTETRYKSEQGTQHWGIKDLRVQYNSYVKDFEIKVFNYEKPEELIKDQCSAKGHDQQDAMSIKGQKVLSMQTVNDKQEVQNIISSYATDANNVPECINGSSGYKNLAVGGTFKLQGKIFDKTLASKEYVVTNLRLVIDDTEGTYENVFTGILKDCVLKPIAQKKNFSGLHSAIVVNKEQSESDEPFFDKKGQVYTYVKMHWGVESICRALVITPFNTVNVPKPGALVQVGFLQNESYCDIPFVWGMHPPKIEELLDYEKADHNVLSLYAAFHTTKEKDLFNSILFKDKKDEQEIEIRAKKDQYSYIGNMRQALIGFDKREEVPEKEESDKEILLIKKGNRKEIICDGNDVLNVNKGDILIDVKDGNYTLKCKKKVTIEAEEDISLSSKKNIHLSSDKKIIMEAKEGFEMSSSKDLNIKVNNMNAATQGAYKVDSMSATIGAKQGINVKAGTELKAEGGVGATLKGGATAKVEGGGMTEIKGGMVKAN